MKTRIAELDFIKGIMIFLVVAFHLNLVISTYPVVTSIVYVFHIPTFLIISGYLTNVEKDFKTYLKGLGRLIVPYLFFESIYILMIFFLGKYFNANNSISELTVIDFFKKILIDPAGIYWYIHTLIYCSVSYYISYKLLKLKDWNALLCMGLILYIFIVITGSSMKMGNIIYYIIGVFIMRSGKIFTEMIKPSLLAIIPLIIIIYNSEIYSRDTIAGVAITLLVISMLLFVYRILPVNSKVSNLITYLGKNSLSVVYFSPIYTIVAKFFNPIFSFDSTALLYFVIATSFVIALSIFTALILDRLKMTRYIFMKENIYVKF
jgi:fucose 4-O-acetylase-like acetyltransferase